MKAVIQRVSKASVTIDGSRVANINHGLLILLGITHDDEQSDEDWLVNKIGNLRIFNDAQGVMNQSVMDVNGEVIVVSQFTLHASTKKGNRPSYINAAKPDIAIPRYESFVAALSMHLKKPIQTGEFGADMQVELLNDGPVTIIIDTKDRK